MSINDAIFDFVYGEAMRDATLMKAFEGKKSTLKDLENPKMKVKEYIDNVINGKHPCFDKTVENLLAAFSEESIKEFTFGNAQKLINMTAKHFFVITYYENDEVKRNCFSGCHCPMDSIIVSKVKKDIDEIIKKDNKSKDNLLTKANCPDDYKNKWKSYLGQSWSKVEIQQYAFFQNLVGIICKEKKIMPIEYDFINWKKEDNKS